MASAFLSLPPPWSFGSSDLKANARKFLQRALVISALVHLAAVGVFRAALERFAATEAEVPNIETPWRPPPVFMPPFRIIPPGLQRYVDTPYKVGEIIPVPKTTELNPIERNFPSAEPGPLGPEPRTGPSGPDIPGPPPSPGPPVIDPFAPVDTPPVPLVAPRPPYPTWAREAGIEGRVLVRVLVGRDGIPKRAVVVSGPKGLTDGIESALMRWKFSAGLSNRTPVECWVEIPISFRLQD
jgi:protein TonB